MSSAEDDYNDQDGGGNLGQGGSKKRRVQRACDICRRKKIRCDGGQMPGNRCSNCIAYNFECAYVEAAKKRGPPKGYVESLESRLEKMEKLLSKVCPDADFSQELGGGPIRKDAWLKSNGAQSSSMPASGSAHTPPHSATSRHGGGAAGGQTTPLEDLVSSDDEVDMLELKLTESIRKMAIDPMRHRFFGKSSGVTLIQKAIDLKNEYTGDQINSMDFFSRRRPEFDVCHPWEIAGKKIDEPTYIFPDPDIARELIDLYFDYSNPMAPLLHRPTFERKYADALHLRDSAFGSVVLLVCAVAARWCEDPRVMLPDTESEHSAGWKYFEQVQMVRKTLLGPPCLEDLQVYCLSVLFLQGTSAPQACWTIVGIGIRLAQDVGAHRRKVYNNDLTVEDELWKRAFWILVSLDRSLSSALGRPCAIQDEDFDLDLPVVCDDEYWEHPDPEQAFKQPPDKPSYVAYFISYLKLNQILAFALRTIYSINKSKVLLGFVGQQWEQHIVAELDSALNKWIDSVPDHLRWDPSIPDRTFLLQSCTLYASYYHTQIIIHRPFIPSPRKPSPLSFPSLAICTNAARSCSHVIDGYRRRVGTIPSSVQVGLQIAAFTAGIVLLLNIWGGKRSGLAIDPVKEMADVHKCMAALKQCENRYHSAGRLWDILYELASVGDLPLPQASPIGTGKRERDDDSPASAVVPLSNHTSPSSGSNHPTPETQAQGPRHIAGSRRVTRDSGKQSHSGMQQHSPVSATAPTRQSHVSPPAHSPLPVYSNDLGRLPLHGPMSFGAAAPPSPQPPHGHVQHQPRGSTGFDTPSMWFGAGPGGQGTSSMMGQSGPAGAGAGTSASAGAAPHVPYGVDELLYHQMFGGHFSEQHAGQATQGSSAPSAGPGGFSDASMEGLLMGPQPGPSGQRGATSPSNQPQGHGMNGMGGTPMSGMGEVNGMNGMHPMLDADTIAMWSNAPSGFEMDDWGSYISSVSNMNYDGSAHHQHPHQHQHGHGHGHGR